MRAMGYMIPLLATPKSNIVVSTLAKISVKL
jgi:hypothetical protein